MSSKKQRAKQRRKPHAKTSTTQPSGGPVVHHYTAKVRSPLGEWWHDHQRTVKLSAGIGSGAIVVGWLLAELVHLLLFNSPF